MPDPSRDSIYSEVSQRIDGIFEFYAVSYCVDSGDFAPEQVIDLNRATDTITDLLMAWINQNRGDNIQDEPPERDPNNRVHT